MLSHRTLVLVVLSICFAAAQVPGPNLTVEMVVNKSDALQVTWKGHTDITMYNITWSREYDAALIGTEETHETTFNITDLEAFTSYVICVAAKVDAGYGPEACEVGTTDEDEPSPPRNVKVTRTGTTFFELEWDEPEKSNGEIIDYEITYNNGSYSNEVNTGSSQTTFNLTSLVPCTDYTVSVAAVTINGTGDPSSPVQSATDLTAPGAPSNLVVEKVVDKPHWLSVICTPPEAPGPLCPVTNNSVRWALASGGGDLGSEETDVNKDYAIIGLKPYTEYKVCVKAKTEGGYGEEVCENATTDQDIPSSPRNVKVTRTETTFFELEWDEPEEPNGEITDYNITYKNGSNSNNVTTGSTQTTFTLTSLVPCTDYTVSVAASTVKGFGNPSSKIEKATDLTAPGAPTNVLVERVENESHLLNVSWTASEDPGPLCPITKHNVRWTLASGGGDLNFTETEDSGFNVTGLRPYTEYKVCVKAKSEGGDGEEVCENGTTDQDIPSAPTNTWTNTTSNSSILVSWEPPETPNGIITNYNISWDCNEQGSSGNLTNITNYSITDLRPCSICSIIVMAATVKGYGDKSEVNGITNNELPPPPLSVMCQSGPSPSDSILVTWEPPNTLCNVTSFNVTCNGDILWSDEENSHTSEPSDTSTNFDSLIPWTFYNVCVAGVLPNKAVGEESCCTITTDEAASGPPLSFSAEAIGSRAINVSWDGPDEANGNITGFLLKWGNEELEVPNATARQEIISGLSPNSFYNISLQAHNGCGCGETTFAVATTTKEVNVVGIIAGVVTGLVLVVVAIVLFLYRNKIKSLVATSSRRSSDDEPLRVMSGRSMEIKKKDLRNHIRYLEEDDQHGLREEFSRLNEQSPNHSTSSAAKGVNKPKNRYVDILPFDHSRVVLQEKRSSAQSDYVNANYIKDHRGHPRFIAAQGPKSNTVDDFWRMVWELQVYTIVMLTNLVEKGKNKCEKYWPDVGEKPLQCDECLIVNQNEERNSLHNTRFLEVIHGHHKRVVKQFHFLVWPDFGAPTSEDHLLDFITAVRNSSNVSRGPILVHCSAGVGRTGTFIGLWNLMDIVNNRPNSPTINVQQTVLEMRQNRCTMVQSKEQYIYLYKCITAYMDSPEQWNNQVADQDGIYDNMGFETPVYENL